MASFRGHKQREWIKRFVSSKTRYRAKCFKYIERPPCYWLIRLNNSGDVRNFILPFWIRRFPILCPALSYLLGLIFFCFFFFFFFFFKRKLTHHWMGGCSLEFRSSDLSEWVRFNLVPRALFPGFGGGAPGKAREKRPGDEIGFSLPFLCVRNPVQLWNGLDIFRMSGNS